MRQPSQLTEVTVMLVELSIIPVGIGLHTSDELADVLRIIDDSGLSYQLTPSATCIEGTWSEVMPVIQRCHEQVRQHCPHVITQIKIEDDQDASDKLSANISSIEEKLKRPLSRNPPRQQQLQPLK